MNEEQFKRKILKLALLIDLLEKVLVELDPVKNFGNMATAGMLTRLKQQATRVRRDFDSGLNTQAEEAGNFFDEVDDVIDNLIKQIQ